MFYSECFLLKPIIIIFINLHASHPLSGVMPSIEKCAFYNKLSKRVAFIQSAFEFK